MQFRWKKSVEPGPVVKRSVGDPLVAVGTWPLLHGKGSPSSI